jgi:putative ABC transport system permease protein
MLDRIKVRLRALLRKNQVEQELDEELRFHLDNQIERNAASGMNPHEARAAALQSFGAVELLKEQSRDARGVRLLEELAQDLRYGTRMLVKQPGFSLVLILTLAVGIGANTAIFSVVNAVLLRPLPYSNPDRLIAIWGRDLKAGEDHSYLSFDDFNDYQQSTETFETLAAFSPQWSFTLTGLGDAERLNGFFASSTIFPLLNIQPSLGRGFGADEDKQGAPPIALLSHGLWQRRFGGDPEIVGRNITVDGQSITVIGVMPASFRWLEEADLWRPLTQNPAVLRGRAVRIVSFVGRLKPGISIDQARVEMETISSGLAKQYPASNTNIATNLVPLHDEITGKVRRTLLVLLGAVGLVLLIACANVANLLLARSGSRAREMAVRASLGASRRRLIAQMLTESVLIATIAAAAGLVLAFWGVDLLVSLSPVEIPRQNDIKLDPTVLSFTAVLAILTGFIFGLIPALQASRANLTGQLKEGGRGSIGPGRHPARSALVILEIALSLVVVTASGLLLRSFAKLQGVDAGINTESVLSFDMPMSSSYQDGARRLAFYRQLYERIEGLPGVIAVGDVTRLPLAGRGGNPTSSLAIEGVPVPQGERPQIDFRRAGGDYFQAMGISLVSGRTFDERDIPTSEPVVVINQTAARRFLADPDPVGRRVGFGSAAEPQLYRIVGVVGDVRHLGLHEEPRPEAYIAASQAPPFGPVVVIRSSADTTVLISSVRALLREMDPNVPMFNIETMQQIRYESLAQPRFQVLLFGLFGTMALLLAVVGVYGVMAYSVSQRTHEVGLRMALGAQRGDVQRLVVGEGMKLTGIGILLGLPAALGATRLLDRLLFGVAATDAITYAVVGAVLAIAALVACFIPARRASRVDPMTALRYE